MSKKREPVGGRGERSRLGISDIVSEPQHSGETHKLLPCRPIAALSPSRTRRCCTFHPSGSRPWIPHIPRSFTAPLVLICNPKHGFNLPAGGSQSYCDTSLSAIFGSMPYLPQVEFLNLKCKEYVIFILESTGLASSSPHLSGHASPFTSLVLCPWAPCSLRLAPTEALSLPDTQTFFQVRSRFHLPLHSLGYRSQVAPIELLFSGTVGGSLLKFLLYFFFFSIDLLF